MQIIPLHGFGSFEQITYNCPRYQPYILYLKHIADYIYESYEAEDYYYEAIDESYHDGILLPLGNWGNKTCKS